MATLIHESIPRRVNNPSPGDRPGRTTWELRSGPRYHPFRAPFWMVPGRCFGGLVRCSAPKSSFGPFGRTLLLLIPLSFLPFILCIDFWRAWIWTPFKLRLRHRLAQVFVIFRDRLLHEVSLHFSWNLGDSFLAPLDGSWVVVWTYCMMFYTHTQALVLSGRQVFSRLYVGALLGDRSF